MTLKQIFDNVQYGEEYTKFKAIKESLEKNFDKETNTLHADGRIKDIEKSMILEQKEEQKIDRIISKLASIQDRIESGKSMSDAYRKMQASSIMEDCDSLTTDINCLKHSADINKKEGVAKIIATAKYFVENYVDDKAVLKECKNPLFGKMIAEEEDNIKQVF